VGEELDSAADVLEGVHIIRCILADELDVVCGTEGTPGGDERGGGWHCCWANAGARLARTVVAGISHELDDGGPGGKDVGP